MIPTIVIVGRPNVGKSTLFNCLTRTRRALVANQPGVTRDRLYGHAEAHGRQFVVVDTGGLVEDKAGINPAMQAQVQLAIDEADIVLFMVDARDGLTAADENIAQQLRARAKPVYLLINKIDGLDADVAQSEFYQLGFRHVVAIAAAHGRGLSQLTQQVVDEFPQAEEETADTASGIKIAIIGRPNVGKSTLVNRLLGEQRVLVFDQAGTTRDSIFIPFERDGQTYTLIDTAGVRRKRGIKAVVEKFSVIKSLQAIEIADVVIFVVDAHTEVAAQDARLLDFIVDAGTALVVAVNKWDGLDETQRQTVRSQLDKRLRFVEFAETYFISALHGSNVGLLIGAVKKTYQSATNILSTNALTRILEKAVASHQPPLVHGRRIKLRYAHAGGAAPPVIVIHGNQVEKLPATYQRYLVSYFRRALQLTGTPIRLVLKTSVNPYGDKKNVLTSRQTKRRKRLLKHVKK